MDLRKIFLQIQLVSVALSTNYPQIESRVYNKDYSVALRGVHVTKSSWASSRVNPTMEKSFVACATKCVDKYRDDLSCNSMMYAQETLDCHLGNTTLPSNAGEVLEFVYRIPDGTGENICQIWAITPSQVLHTENMECSTSDTTSKKLPGFPLWMNVLKDARIVSCATFGGGK